MSLGSYLAVSFTCEDSFRDFLIAELDLAGFESMMETDEGLEAYLPEDHFDEQALKTLIARYPGEELTYSVTSVQTRNWNEEWESNYEPIIVDDKCLVRAVFHSPDPSFPYELIINPRMSFGTGHHATTYLMLRHQLGTDHKDKRVLDAGCGTAILAVMAEKLGASEVIAYDNNAWTIENAPENIELNNCTKVSIKEGTINTINISGTFHIILANINKNVLLEEMATYVSYLAPGGVLMLSGFYDSDQDDISNLAVSLGLSLVESAYKNHWAALLFQY